ncbi:MAG: adenosylhomocysteinase, partial [Ruminiclostridium sp.]|nr:adenosylhomocysteinase [Ruminiclostridium sp.]
VAVLKRIAKESHLARNNIMCYTLEDGRRINVIAEGRLVNLAAGDGHPAEIMDMSFAIQLLSALYIVQHKGQLDSMIINVPKEIDNEVAERKLKFWGIEIDKLTKEQQDYMNSTD